MRPRDAGTPRAAHESQAAQDAEKPEHRPTPGRMKETPVRRPTAQPIHFPQIPHDRHKPSLLTRSRGETGRPVWFALRFPGMMKRNRPRGGVAMRWNRVLTGDCVELLKAVPAGSVDLAFADPPFNIGYE